LLAHRWRSILPVTLRTGTWPGVKLPGKVEYRGGEEPLRDRPRGIPERELHALSVVRIARNTHVRLKFVPISLRDPGLEPTFCHWRFIEGSAYGTPGMASGGAPRMNDGRAPGAAVGAGAYPARAAILTRTATRVRNEERGAQTNNSYSGNRGKITAVNGV
jgi:hypothetical protein